MMTCPYEREISIGILKKKKKKRVIQIYALILVWSDFNFLLVPADVLHFCVFQCLIYYMYIHNPSLRMYRACPASLVLGLNHQYNIWVLVKFLSYLYDVLKNSLWVISNALIMTLIMINYFPQMLLIWIFMNHINMKNNNKNSNNIRFHNVLLSLMR